MKRLAVASGLAFVLVAAPAGADEGTDFIAKVVGSWSGSGVITSSPGETPGATNCSLSATASGRTVDISGVCDGAGRGAHLSVVLTWVPATREFTGTFMGAAETGRASLAGKINGSTVSLNYVSSSGAHSNLSFSVSGTSAKLVASGKDAASGKSMTWVTLALRKS